MGFKNKLPRKQVWVCEHLLLRNLKFGSILGLLIVESSLLGMLWMVQLSAVFVILFSFLRFGIM